MAFGIMPLYTAALREQGLSGEVTLALTIDKNGRVLETTFARGERRLADVSAKAVRLWKIKPYLLDGQPVEITGLITFDFQSETGKVRLTTKSETASNVKTP